MLTPAEQFVATSCPNFCLRALAVRFAQPLDLTFKAAGRFCVGIRFIEIFQLRMLARS